MVDESEYQRWSHYSAECRDNRHQGLFDGGELSVLHLTSDLKADSEEEDSHQDVVDEALDSHSFREPDILSSGGLKEQGELSLKDVVIYFFSKGKVCQKHGYHYSPEEDNPLGPRLVGEFASTVVEVSYAFSPSVDGKQSHDNYSPYK